MFPEEMERGSNRTFMELKSWLLRINSGQFYVLIVPLWN